MANDIFTMDDLRQLAEAGISQELACRQIDFLKGGVMPLRLNRPCTVGDGIVVIGKGEQPDLVALHDSAARRGRFMKFVPASGAASRMFSHWYNLLEDGSFQGAEETKTFVDNLRKFAFFPDLKRAMESRGMSIEDNLRERRLRRILQFILSPEGLNYGQLPKALIKFHVYENGPGRTPLEEHLVEAALYTADEDRRCPIHFTVTEEHRKTISLFLEEIMKRYENLLRVAFRIGLSSQSPSTQTLALDGEKLYRDESGRLFLRPGGHGALLKNLQDIHGDIVIIKNIDNVAPDHLKPPVTLHNKVLGGYFISLESEIFRLLRRLASDDGDREAVGAAHGFCRSKLSMTFPDSFESFPISRKGEFLFHALNRPLRVCGMVRNEGEPGGGPFWVDDGDGQSRQIVERHQIDQTDEQQKALWQASTHFNPVDMACGLRDYQARNFFLPRFADQEAVTLTGKTERGKTIKALEYPGLWNAGMAHWNTVFIEVPIATFNPVKTIDDLLRPQHLPGN